MREDWSTRALRRVRLRRLAYAGGAEELEDTVAAEGIVLIEVPGAGRYELAATPAELRALAVGFALTEGLIGGLEEVAALAECPEEETTVRLVPAARPRRAPERTLAARTSCDLCGGRRMVEDFLERPAAMADTLRVPAAALRRALGEMRRRQEIFRETGGTHAAALFDGAGRVLAFAEDVGRHNALDKAVGKRLLAGGSTRGLAAALSGRAGVEMVMKAARAGIELVAAVSAATSLALEAAERAGLTLCAFSREKTVNVYTHPHRLREEGP